MQVTIDKQTKTINCDRSSMDQLFREFETFCRVHPYYLNIPENNSALQRYLAERELAPVFDNLRQAYQELLEEGRLHTTPPDPRPIGGTNPHIPQPRPKVGQYKGSHYDKTEIARFKREIALMNAQQIKECLQANGWSDWPAFLKAGN
jgi:hypothetical protein